MHLTGIRRGEAVREIQGIGHVVARGTVVKGGEVGRTRSVGDRRGEKGRG